MKKVELLAPVGGFQNLYGVINAGADAVYLSGKKFGARAYASNFDDEELIEAIKICHLFNVKVYLTLNTLIKESEFDSIYDYLKPLVENALDGIIVQDVGVIKFINDHFKALPIHISTQCSVLSKYAVDLFKEYNVTRIVPARELSLEEIINIKNDTGIEIESFIHGAMCYCYSGKCLFSAIIGQRSGNRGRCAQPCRLPYNLKNDNKELYPLSMKDMCTLPVLDKLIDAGIDSFKIEGRMKKPEYAAGVTAIYRKYIDRVYDGSFNKIDKEDWDMLNNLYIRKDIQDGYYFKRNSKDMITINSPAYKATDEELLKTIYDEYVNKKPRLSINCNVKFIVGEPFSISLSFNNTTVETKGQIVEEAKNAPISYDRLKDQVSKLGDSYFELSNIKIDYSDNGFMSIKEINAVRRECVDKLMECIINEK